MTTPETAGAEATAQAESLMSTLVEFLAVFPDVKINPAAWSQLLVYAPRRGDLVGERRQASEYAESILDSGEDPDSDLMMLARQFTRALDALAQWEAPDTHIMRGKITLSDGVRAGKLLPFVALAGQLEALGRGRVMLALQFDYHVFPPASGLIRMSARSINERDKFSTWPNEA